MMIEADADSEVTAVSSPHHGHCVPLTQWLQIHQSSNDRPRRWGYPSRFLRSGLSCAPPMSRRACGKTAVTEPLRFLPLSFFSFFLVLLGFCLFVQQKAKK